MPERVTPTGLAEARRDAEIAHCGARIAKHWPVNPAGLAVPFARSVFRKTMDAKLLVQLVEAAGAAFEREQLPPHDAWATGALLIEDLERRYPPTDMAVLARYGVAREIGQLSVAFEPYHQRAWLPAGIGTAVPNNAPGYVVALPGARINPADRLVPVPEEARNYFLRVIETRRIIREEIRPADREPGQFTVREKRQPMWGDIEAVWPRFGAWMASQREALR